ncbi:unnamed protein product [Leuciscus chuanchicus]
MDESDESCFEVESESEGSNGQAFASALSSTSGQSSSSALSSASGQAFTSALSSTSGHSSSSALSSASGQAFTSALSSTSGQSSSSVTGLASRSAQVTTPDNTPWESDYSTYLSLIQEFSENEDEDLCSAIMASIEDQTASFKPAFSLLTSFMCHYKCTSHVSDSFRVNTVNLTAVDEKDINKSYVNSASAHTCIYILFSYESSLVLRFIKTLREKSLFTKHTKHASLDHGSKRRSKQALQRDEPSKPLANAAFYSRTCCAFRRLYPLLLYCSVFCVCVCSLQHSPLKELRLFQDAFSCSARARSEPIAYGDSEDSPGILSEAALPGSGRRD